MSAKHGSLRILAAMTFPIGMAAATLGLAAWLAATSSQPPRHPRGVRAQVIIIDDMPPVPCPLLGNVTSC